MIPFQYVIRAPKAGVIEKVFYKVGDTVSKGAALVHFKEEETSSENDNGSDSESS